MWGCAEEVNHNKTISAIFETGLPKKLPPHLKCTLLCLVKDSPSVGGQNKPQATQRCTHARTNEILHNYYTVLNVMFTFQAAQYTYTHKLHVMSMFQAEYMYSDGRYCDIIISNGHMLQRKLYRTCMQDR